MWAEDPQVSGGTATAPATSLLERLAQHLETDPLKVACYRVALKKNQFVLEGLTFGELAIRAGQYRRALRIRGLEPGQRLMLSISDPHELLALTLGAMTCGVTTVPMQTLGEFRTSEMFLRRLHSVSVDCKPSLMVVENLEQFNHYTHDLPLLPSAIETRMLRGELGGGDHALLKKERAELVQHSRDPECWVIIQYTSGSIGDPRGVVVTQGNLAANVFAIGAVTETTAEDRVISWLPLHHDMGLIGCLLFGLYWGATTYILSPLTFFTHPVSWLRAIDQFRGTLTAGPTFAYSMCWRKIPAHQLTGLDLSSCRVATCGAEPIPAEVVQGFSQRFGPYGFRPTSFFPVYGLAESTLAASFPGYGEGPHFDHVDRFALAGQGYAAPVEASAPQTMSLVSVGQAMPGHQIRIEDPDTGEECAERQVGEILVQGPSISPYYFSIGLDFRGFSAEHRLWLRTGDLGYLAKGRLFVVDRLKDLVIIAGQNFSATDLEGCIADIRGLRLGRVVAFSLPGEGTDTLHMLAELDPRSWRRQQSIRYQVVQRVAQCFGLTVASFTFLLPGTMPKTSSGKLRRATCRKEFLAGKYLPLTPWTRLQLKWSHAQARLLGLLSS